MKKHIPYNIFAPHFRESMDSIKPEFHVKSDFRKAYENLLCQMMIAAECAKVYILNNWEKVKDWSDLDAVIEDSIDEPTVYYNYKPIVRNPNSNNPRLHSMTLENHRKRRHNPVVSFSGVVMDEIDGDFSLTINDKHHLWISNDSIIVIADYIEKQLEKQKSETI